MYIDIITIIAAGFAAAGIVMILNRLTGKRLPRWVIPAGAGAGMILMSLTNEYRWYPRTLDLLPEGFEVISSAKHQAIYSPWTYAVPYVDRFVAVDVAGIKRNEAQPDLRLSRVIVFARWEPVQVVPVVIDCVQGRSALLDPDAMFNADGTIRVARWDQTGMDDPATAAVCKGG
ncbi:MAG: hypothetical protein P8N68_12750 [Paracoccaceae bacterium]|jgi:hypothetical protein|nr:hypothetical protein [Paracoccaceae bacterium]